MEGPPISTWLLLVAIYFIFCSVAASVAPGQLFSLLGAIVGALGILVGLFEIFPSGAGLTE